MGNKIHPDCLGTHYLPCQIAELKAQLQAEKKRAEAIKQAYANHLAFDREEDASVYIEAEAQRILAEKKK